MFKSQNHYAKEKKINIREYTLFDYIYMRCLKRLN